MLLISDLKTFKDLAVLSAFVEAYSNICWQSSETSANRIWSI